MSSAIAGAPEELVAGVLHVYVAFDWGEEINLDQARELVPAERHVLPRRRRTPPSITFRPPPLRFQMAPVSMDLPGLGAIEVPAEATVFDFAAVSLALHIPIQLSAEALTDLAGHLAEPSGIVQKARKAMQPLFKRLMPAIQNPQWQDDFSEEYFVFQLQPTGSGLPSSTSQSAWLAGLVRLESGPLSTDEVAEAMRLSIRYSPEDLLVADWAAAVLIDRDCDETLQTIEFANLQLLEFRHIDNRLDDDLTSAYGMIHESARSRLPFWRSPAKSLRRLGELKVEANGLFERTGNVLKLVGDQYLARVYRLMAARFHLEQWEKSILRNLEVTEGVYQVLSDQTSTYRAEFLEIMIVLLIVIEIVLAWVRH
jgi:hypothetical protein